MNKSILLVALLASSASLSAQNINVNDLASQSASGAEANSGSVSGAQANNQQNGNVGVSTNTNTSTSNSGAVSVSESESQSNSDQNQGQEQGQGQDQQQGQAQDQTATNANEQGVTVNQTWNTKNRRTTEQRTNNAVPLTSSSSFSSDYCGGTVSGGASAAPLGISIGASKPAFDKSCQSLRRAEKFGMAAVNALNMGQPELSGRLMSMMIWSICTSDSNGTEVAHQTAQACMSAALLGSDASSRIAQPTSVPTPQIARKGKVTPEAAYRSAQADQSVAAAAKPPR